MSSKSDTRLTELESRLAHHEHNADEISEVLAEQARVIDELSQRLRRLNDRVAALEAGGAGAPPDDRPPPHY
jgi:SlyX protein